MRLDLFLVENGFLKSRSKAQAAISEGLVLVNGQMAEKASLQVSGDEKIELTAFERFVSRAGEKLAQALKEFEVDVKDLIALDIGASTGGFTDCLLQNGVRHVFSLDVGTAQLDERLRNDSRVTVMENFNARNARKSDFETDIDIIVMDVSFISQTLIYPACADILASNKTMITLIKPQFEAGKANIGKGGIVNDRNGKILEEILQKIDYFASEHGFSRYGICDSPILGGDGNREYLVIFKKI